MANLRQTLITKLNTELAVRNAITIIRVLYCRRNTILASTSKVKPSKVSEITIFIQVSRDGHKNERHCFLICIVMELRFRGPPRRRSSAIKLEHFPG